MRLKLPGLAANCRTVLTLTVCFLATSCLCCVSRAQDDIHALGNLVQQKVWPDIKSPGIELGDFPNSAFTLPARTMQLELAPLSVVGEDEFNRPEYFTQFMLRFGLTDDVEFRILGNGPTWLYTEPQNSGFSPIALDLKVHLWDDRREVWLPASSLEVMLSTEWGSSFLSSGYQPTIKMNFDLPITEKLNLQTTLGYGEAAGSIAVRNQSNQLTTLVDEINQVIFQWSFEKDVSDDLQVFITGQTLESVPGQTAGTSLATGGYLRRSDRLMFFGLLDWGLTSDAPKIGAQAGFGYAIGRAK